MLSILYQLEEFDSGSQAVSAVVNSNKRMKENSKRWQKSHDVITKEALKFADTQANIISRNKESKVPGGSNKAHRIMRAIDTSTTKPDLKTDLYMKGKSLTKTMKRLPKMFKSKPKMKPAHA